MPIGKYTAGDIAGDPADFSDQYNTPIPAAREKEFAAWVAKQKQATGKDPLNDRYDYDVNGFFLSGGGKDDRGHGTDKFKKPNHPTFSDESQYHGLHGYVGGSWTPAGYQPSTTNLEFRSHGELQKYFSEVEPETRLLPSQPVPTPSGQRGNYTLADLAGTAPPARSTPVVIPQWISPSDVGRER